MRRVLEPELMDSPAEAMAYDGMDHADVNRAFVDDLLQAAGGVLAPPQQDGTSSVASGETEVLDLGTGTAQVPIELCQRCEAVRVLAVDAAASMLEVAIRNIDIGLLRERIMLDRVDAKDLPYEDDRFPIVMSNSIVHHIPEPMGVLREALRVARRGGLLFIRDLMRPGDELALLRLVQQYTGGGDADQQKMFADSLHAALSLDEIRGIVAQLGFPAESVRQSSDRHWTWAVRVS